MVLSVGFLLLVLLILSAGLADVECAFGHLAVMPPFFLQTINFVVSFAVIAGRDLKSVLYFRLWMWFFASKNPIHTGNF